MPHPLDRTVILWSMVPGQGTQRLWGCHTDWVNGVAFSLDGSLLASASDNHVVRLWNTAAGQETQALQGHTL